MSRTRSTGNHGEQLAANLLEAKGFVIAERNFRHRRAEVDLIVRQDKLLVFVEVKTRSGTDFGEPETFVTPNQRRLIHSAADAYIHQTDWLHDIRFDIIAITLGHPPDVLHIEDAFY
ncbi:MAG: YraN family protein [Cytophagales bacterium]|jgi:putative endonuclease|nr:YraN family protein [Cytophagales bacterium]